MGVGGHVTSFLITLPYVFFVVGVFIFDSSKNSPSVS
jgi:hypothetical protein